METGELEAAIKLLDDPDDTVFSIVEKRLIEEGINVAPKLVSVLEHDLAYNKRVRVKNILKKIRLAQTIDGLKVWLTDSNDLLRGVWLIERLRYPNLEFKSILKLFDSLKEIVYIDILHNLSPLEQIRYFNSQIYNVLKFYSNEESIYNPRNCFLHNVLEKRTGNPVTMAIVYWVLANSCGIPLYGVNLPQNFILAYILPDERHENVLFYVNPYNKGVVINRNEIEFFLKQHKIKQNSSFFMPCSNETTVLRLLSVLKKCYEYRNDDSKISEIENLENLFVDKLDDSIIWN